MPDSPGPVAQPGSAPCDRADLAADPSLVASGGTGQAAGRRGAARRRNPGLPCRRRGELPGPLGGRLAMRSQSTQAARARGNSLSTAGGSPGSPNDPVRGGRRLAQPRQRRLGSQQPGAHTAGRRPLDRRRQLRPGILRPAGASFVDPLQQRGHSVYWLELGSAGPLVTLGQLKEYAKHVNASRGLWVFTASNDVMRNKSRASDLDTEFGSPRLVQYPDPQAPLQNLVERYPQLANPSEAPIDQRMRNGRAGLRRSAPRRSAHLHQPGSRRSTSAPIAASISTA